jgi:phospholipid/cholesterol/gamma-HCH transport system substrate-binding protein
MPSQQEVKWSQLKVGLIVLVSTTLLCSLLFLLTSSKGMSVFSHKIDVTSYFANSGGIKAGAPVELEGVTIGEVTHVLIVTDPARRMTPVKIEMKLDPRYQSSLHTDSVVTLSKVGVLGDNVVDISSQSAHGPALQSGDELKAVETPGIDDIVAKMNNMIDTLQKGQGTAGKLIMDPELYNEATATVKELHLLAVDLNRGQGTAGKLLHDPELYNRLNETAAKLNDTSAKLDTIAGGLSQGKGSAGKLLTDDRLYNNLNAALQHANSLLAQVDAGKGSIGILMKDPTFANNLNDTVTRVDTLVTNVNNGKGSLGKFATDDAAYNNINKLLTSSTDLVQAIRTDPKKYLTIRMKIF